MPEAALFSESATIANSIFHILAPSLRFRHVSLFRKSVHSKINQRRIALEERGWAWTTCYKIQLASTVNNIANKFKNGNYIYLHGIRFPTNCYPSLIFFNPQSNVFFVAKESCVVSRILIALSCVTNFSGSKLRKIVWLIKLFLFAYLFIHAMQKKFQEF